MSVKKENRAFQSTGGKKSRAGQGKGKFQDEVSDALGSAESQSSVQRVEGTGSGEKKERRARSQFAHQEHTKKKRREKGDCWGKDKESSANLPKQHRAGHRSEKTAPQRRSGDSRGDCTPLHRGAGCPVGGNLPRLRDQIAVWVGEGGRDSIIEAQKPAETGALSLNPL